MGRRNEQQAANALPHVRLVVQAHTHNPKRKRQIIDEWRNLLKAAGHPNPSARSIEKTISRMSGDRDLSWRVPQESKFPEVETAWFWAHALRHVGWTWSWPPLTYLAFGHFPAFVESMATCDLSVLPVNRLCSMIDGVWPLMNGEDVEYTPWAIPEKMGQAFLHPEAARAAYEDDERHDRFAIAHTIARNFSLGYEVQTFAIVEQLKRWAEEIRENPPDSDANDRG